MVAEISESDKSSGEVSEKLVINNLAEEPEKTTKRIPVMMKTKGTAAVKRVPIQMTFREKTTTSAPSLKVDMSEEQLDELVEMAVERLKEMEEHAKGMEELKEDGLVILEPQEEGEILSVDKEAKLDGMRVVEFEAASV